MIDDKKIEEASFEETFGMYGESDSLEQGFICGAKWAINEFLKDLWHPASEIPELGRIFIMENHYCDGRIVLHSYIRCETFHNPLDPTTQKWFYLDDLLPKQKGE